LIISEDPYPTPPSTTYIDFIDPFPTGLKEALKSCPEKVETPILPSTVT